MRRQNPVNDETRDRAKGLRQTSTAPEHRLWKCLRNRQLAGLKFYRQAPIDRDIVDFLCREQRIVIEVDGDSHADRGAYDARRTREIENLGYRIVRVSNDEVLSDIENVLMCVVLAAGLDGERWRKGEFGQIRAFE
jgi:very-short-patch-repair endonuclease